MKRIIALLMAMMMLLTACGGGSTEENSTDTEGNAGEPVELNLVYDSEFSHLNYMTSSISSVTSFLYSLIDGLVDFDEYGIIKGALAEDYSVSEDGLVYTFNLRKGVKWYTSTGEEYAEVTANDFVTSAKYILTQENASTTSNILYDIVKNGKKYYDGEITDFNEVGIKAIDDYTLEYTLEKPTPYFVSMVSYVCFLPVNEQFLEETGDLFATGAEYMLYNGAYIMETFEPENRRVLVKNQNYYDKEHIYIDKINYSFNKEASTLSPELFLRGEIDRASITSEILDEWMKDPEKSQMITKRSYSSTTNFIGLNFEPLYGEEYNPSNWSAAVNNLNFRKSLFHAVDRKAAVMAYEPFNPEDKLINTNTAPEVASVNGVDYTELPALKHLNEKDFYDKDLALSYKEKAMEELKDTVSFPVTIVWNYNTSSKTATNMAQIIEQQLEKTLGTDYVDVVIVAYPPTGYLKAARSSGTFSMMEMGWGPDYPDPISYTDVMMSDVSIGKLYSRPYLAKDCLDENGESKYEQLVKQAREENVDIAKRYQLLSEAEAFLIDNALIIPFYRSGGGYEVTKLDPFSGNNTMFGRSADKLKGKKMLEKPLTPDEFKAAEEAYNKAKAEAIKVGTSFGK